MGHSALGLEDRVPQTFRRDGMDLRAAHGHAIALRRIAAPTLLIWGDSDPISPVAVGRHLESCIANAELPCLPGGDQ